jgi:hypothetical protein
MEGGKGGGDMAGRREGGREGERESRKGGGREPHKERVQGSDTACVQWEEGLGTVGGEGKQEERRGGEDSRRAGHAPDVSERWWAT